jgi:hypothetical protein
VISDSVAAQPTRSVPAGALLILLGRLDATTAGTRRPSWATASLLAAIVMMFAMVLLVPSAQISIDFSASAPERIVLFNVYRSEAAEMPGDKVLTSPAQELVSNGGYSFTDSSVRPGRSYYYWLEAQSVTGETTLAGPYSVVPSNALALAKAAAVFCLVVGLVACLRLMRDEMGRRLVFAKPR